MLRNKLVSYVKLLLAIVIGFGFSYFIGKEVFLGFTPKVNPFFAQNISLGIKENLSKILLAFKEKFNSNIAWNINNKQTNEYINNVLVNSLKPIGKGVEADTYENNSYIKYDLNKVEWIEKKLVKNDGTVVTIKVPKLNN